MLKIDLCRFAFWMFRSFLVVSMSFIFTGWTKISSSNVSLLNKTSSSDFYFLTSRVSDNQVPLVAIFEPANLKIFSNGEPINVVVSAFDFDGSSHQSRFILNGSLISTDNSFPYSWTGLPALQSLTVGTYTLRALATDNLGATSEHVITFFVAGGGVNNQSPTVSFEVPFNNQQFPSNSNLYVKANASDGDGSISKVDLFVNGVFLRTETTAPFEWGTDVADTRLFSMQAGSYTLKAVATDNKGAIAETSIVVTIVGGGTSNTPPTVFFTAPTNEQSFPLGTNLSVSVNATDNNGIVNNVELFFNGSSLGQDPSAPYTWGTGLTALQNLQAGTYTLRAVATDNEGARGEQTISITVVANNNIPTVQFTSPLNQQIFPAGTDLQVAVTASDSDGSIANVELFFNGNTLGQDATAPYNWGATVAQLQDLSAGTYTLRAVATDNEGAKGEQTISITVTPNTSNNVPPTVNFSFPSNQQNFPVGVNILVVASATDSDGTVAGVELYVNGALLRRDNITPYQWGDLSSDTAIRNLQAGNYILRAVAYDNLGATGERTITMTVGSGSANQPPNLSFTAPTNNQTFPTGTNLMVETNASDPDGTIAHVTLYLNNVLVRQDVALPFRWEGTTDPALRNLQAGTYTLRAVAEDNAGASKEQTIQITVQPDNNTGTVPVVRFLIPTHNDTLLQGSNLVVEVSATSNGSAITKVDLFRDNVFIRTEAAAPYEWGKSTTNDATLRNLQAGKYQFKAVATNSKGETGEAAITIIVKATEVPPVVPPITLKFVEPSDQQILPRGTNLYVLLEVQDTISGVKGVELSINDRPLRQKRTAPFDWNGTLRSDTLLRNLQSGTYSLKALAVSNRRDSVRAMISIIINEPPSLNFITPLDQQTFKAGDNILVNIEAADTDGTVADVALYLNNQLIRRDGALPYEWGVNDPALQNLEIGTYQLRAVATDNRGSTVEKEIQIEVISPNSLPEVSFNMPFDGQRLPSGTNLAVNTSATDKDGIIQSVTLYLNDQLIREDLAAPYEWGTSNTQDLTLRNLLPGLYILKAVAKDNQGGIGEAIIDIEIYNTPPTIIFDTPLDQEAIPSGIDLYVNIGAFDSDGSVANVRLFLNNQLIRQDNTAPYEWGNAYLQRYCLKKHTIR
ncbi:MAG: hypothetical protein HC892_09575 [Saprospiraceae bacterium]|nr:hypothetical protein [Saprospiraceae bacterium]